MSAIMKIITHLLYGTFVYKDKVTIIIIMFVVNIAHLLYGTFVCYNYD